MHNVIKLSKIHDFNKNLILLCFQVDKTCLLNSSDSTNSDDEFKKFSNSSLICNNHNKNNDESNETNFLVNNSSESIILNDQTNDDDDDNIKLLETPNLMKSSINFKDDKTLSSIIFTNSKLISSTPIYVNSNYKNNIRHSNSSLNFDEISFVKKRKLLNFNNIDNNCNFNDNNYLTPSSILFNRSKYVSVSSPTSSEYMKLNDSKFFENTSILFNRNNLNNSNLTIENDYEINNVDSQENNLSITSDSICDENDLNKSFKINKNNERFNNDSVNIKFKSFDLLPGIMPLNNSDCEL